MKKTLLFLVLLVVCTSFVGSDMEWRTYKPIFMSRADLEKSVVYKNTGQELKNPGKIYYKAPYIYINERYKGVHVINNSNPAQPHNEGFITAPGCVDMAMKGSVLYLDNAVDLVAFDLATKTVTERIVGIFPELRAPDNSFFYPEDRPSDFVLVEWRKR